MDSSYFLDNPIIIILIFGLLAQYFLYRRKEAELTSENANLKKKLDEILAAKAEGDQRMTGSAGKFNMSGKFNGAGMNVGDNGTTNTNYTGNVQKNTVGNITANGGRIDISHQQSNR